MKTNELVELLNSLTKQRNGIKKDETITYVFGDSLTDDMKTILHDGGFEIMDSYYNLFDSWCSDMSERIPYKIGKDEEINEYSQLEDTIDELLGELEPDIYTSDLTAWLNESIYHVNYLDNVEGTGSNKLSMAQYNWKYEYYNLFNRILEHIIENQ